MFGSGRSIADYSAADTMGAMVGMTVATVQDASACIFTSYNGVGQRTGDRGSLPVSLSSSPSPSRPFEAREPMLTDCIDYELLKTTADGDRVALWEMFVVSSVVLCEACGFRYFTPWSIDGLGTFQDGGLVVNNPSSIALQEVAFLFPEAPYPSLLASLGTGSSSSSSGGGWWDCFLFRLTRVFRNRNKNDWRRVVAQKKVGQSGEFFRFDVEFDGSEPPLDSLSSFDDEEDDGCTFEGLPALRRLVL
ncbi:hypothetical protein CABS01_17221, partial [Colletotrichum abscissum]|uniref:uncharacterized protein n=1 Tax=Colletotrichum abscissum TaxID=1671311 RepID=UPI0027D67FF1